MELDDVYTKLSDVTTEYIDSVKTTIKLENIDEQLSILQPIYNMSKELTSVLEERLYILNLQKYHNIESLRDIPVGTICKVRTNCKIDQGKMYWLEAGAVTTVQCMEKRNDDTYFRCTETFMYLRVSLSMVKYVTKQKPTECYHPCNNSILQ